MKKLLKFVGFTLLVPLIWLGLTGFMLSIPKEYLTTYHSLQVMVNFVFVIYFIIMGALLTYVSERN